MCFAVSSALPTTCLFSLFSVDFVCSYRGKSLSSLLIWFSALSSLLTDLCVVFSALLEVDVAGALLLGGGGRRGTQRVRPQLHLCKCYHELSKIFCLFRLQVRSSV